MSKEEKELEVAPTAVGEIEETIIDTDVEKETEIVEPSPSKWQEKEVKTFRIPYHTIVNFTVNDKFLTVEYKEEKRTNALLEHAKSELKYGGYDISEKGCNPPNPKEPMDGYVNSCAKNAFELLETFSKAGHSGMSAGVTLHLFNKLVNWENLTPLTNNPDEWQKLDDSTDSDWQSKRNSACFTNDFKTYWNIDEEENKIRTSDNSFKMKPKAEWVKHKLEEYKK